MRRRLISVSINDPWQSSDHFDSQNRTSLFKWSACQCYPGCILSWTVPCYCSWLASCRTLLYLNITSPFSKYLEKMELIWTLQFRMQLFKYLIITSSGFQISFYPWKRKHFARNAPKSCVFSSEQIKVIKYSYPGPSFLLLFILAALVVSGFWCWTFYDRQIRHCIFV